MMAKIVQIPVFDHFAAMSADKLREAVGMKGLEHVELAFRNRRPVFLLGSHLGPGQLVSYFMAQMGYPITHLGTQNVFAKSGLRGHKRLATRAVNEKVNEFQLRSVAAGTRALRAGKLILSPGDGAKGASGRARAFLGKLAEHIELLVKNSLVVLERYWIQSFGNFPEEHVRRHMRLPDDMARVFQSS